MPRSASPAPGRGVQSWLERDPSFRELARQVDGLLAMQRALQKACPNAPVTVSSLAAGTLAVTVPGAAWATRLRQTEPSIVAALRRAGLPVDRLKIRPRRGPAAAARRTAPKAPVPAHALDALAALQRELPASPLQQALAGLLSRHAGARR
jgi:hypothetical protein